MPTSYPVGKAPWETPSLSSFPVGEAPWEVTPTSSVVETKKPNYFQRVGQDFADIGQDVISGVKTGADAIQRGGLGATPDVFRAGLRTAGGVARGAFAPILEAPGIKQATEFVVKQALKIPKVEETITEATKLAEKYPNQAKDTQNIIDIVALGYAPKASQALKQEGKALGSDIAQGTKALLTPSEEATQAKIVELFNKSIKPTAKKTLAQGQKYENDTIKALKTIKANVEQLNIEDVTGELISGRTPQSINELAQALDQTKRLVFTQYDNLAQQAGKGGAVIDARPIAEEVLKVAQNKALQLTNPELIKYAEGWAERLQALGTLDTQTTQEVVKNFNNSLTAFYRNPTFESATKVAIDAGIANNFRKALDDAIEGATGTEYQALKNQYGALKAIENDVVRASMRDARKNTKGLLDYTDIFTSGQMLGGILSLNPAMFTKGAVERGFKEWIKRLNDPNRAISNIFDKLDTTNLPPFNPQSATFNYIKNPKLGASIEDVSGSNASNLSKGGGKTPNQVKSSSSNPTTLSKELQPLAQEVRKYKSAEEFVRAQTDPLKELKSGIGIKDEFVARGSVKEAINDIGGIENVRRGSVDITKLKTTENVSLQSPRSKAIMEEVKQGKITPIIADENLEIYDGNHRLGVYQAMGIKEVPVIVPKTTVGVKFQTKSQLTDIWNKANKK